MQSKLERIEKEFQLLCDKNEKKKTIDQLKKICADFT